MLNKQDAAGRLGLGDISIKGILIANYMTVQTNLCSPVLKLMLIF